MATRVFGAKGAAALSIAAVAVAACGLVHATGPIAQPTAHATAAGACRAAALDQTWKVAVEVDRPESSALALVSGDSIAVCLTGRSADGSGFGSTSTAGSRYPVATPAALTYLTAMAVSHDPPSILVGRVPSAAAAVRLVMVDGSEANAVIGGEIWLAWLAVPSHPTLIEALDASGGTISKIEDASGIQPAG